MKPKHEMTRKERHQHHHALRFDLEQPAPSGTQGYWSQAERRKRARRRRATTRTGEGRR